MQISMEHCMQYCMQIGVIMPEFKILNKIVVDCKDDWRSEVQLCQIPEWNDKIKIRICYYKKQKRKGEEFWNIAPRPLVFDFDSAEKIAKAITESINLYTNIARSIKVKR